MIGHTLYVKGGYTADGGLFRASNTFGAYAESGQINPPPVQAGILDNDGVNIIDNDGAFILDNDM